MFYNSLRRRWGRISFSVFFAATIALIARAQAPPDVARQGPPIVRSIDVQYTGPATISRERILAQMRTKIGLPYSDTVAENDIRALYNTGQVQNVAPKIFRDADYRALRTAPVRVSTLGW